jgi:RecA/RadA recombinase
MSGGISAIRGFDYQATVILDLLFDHFDQHGPAAQVRPEGVDDLDLYWSIGTEIRRQFIQIKKPRDDINGERKPSPWSLSEAINELFPNTIENLSDNSHEQVWIVGDGVADELRLLLIGGVNAPTTVGKAYWNVIHILARNDAVRVGALDRKARKKLQNKRLPKNLPSDPVSALATIIDEFESVATRCGAGNIPIAQYRQKATELHAILPDILARIEISSTYGTEQEVIKRVHDRLEQRYNLSRSVIENTLFRNLRGFINDISKQPSRAFDNEALEFELRSVWPEMIYIKEPPALDALHVRRRDLVERIVMLPGGKTIEIIGVSGSGKTTLAAEALEQVRLADPVREVYYAEVRSGVSLRDVSLRDVLVGVAFHLRSIGIVEPFRIAVDTNGTNEDVLTELAHSFMGITMKILLLVDLVDGNCTPAFARDLSTFVRARPSDGIQLAVFGQESALRELTMLERKQLGVEQLNMRGFNVDEFVALVKHNHPNPDYAILSDVFQRVTAGRAAGLFAKLAHSLAHVDSLQEMIKISEMSAEEMLPHAERHRFVRISDASRQAAEKLLCFAFPFKRTEADEIFPDDNIGSAIGEMLTLGLLRPHEDGSFEMHETVRAGLEANIAKNVGRSAHEALAAWYGSQGSVTAEIFHLDKAGRHSEACQRARDSFLQGEHWGALSTYVITNHLVSAQEVVAVIADTKPIGEKYLLPHILHQLGDATAGDELFRILRDQSERFHNDYSWTTAIVEAILKADRSRLYELIQLAVQTLSTPPPEESALDWLSLGARRIDVRIDASILGLFNHQPPEIRNHLIPIMLLDRRREVLEQVFQFIFSYLEAKKNARRSAISQLHYFKIREVEDTVAFLAAMPSVEHSQMLIAKSVFIDSLASFVWSQQKVMRVHCIEILKEDAWDDRILENAVRVLIFLAEPSISTLCDDLISRKSSLTWMSMLIPAMIPAFCDRKIYEQQIFDQGLAVDKRIGALSVLAGLGADLGSLYRRLKANGEASENAELWNYMFLMQCVQHPFAEAIPLLEQSLISAKERENPLLVPLLMKLGMLSTPEATMMLAHAVTHADPDIRRCAAQVLGQRRSRSALSSLVKQLAQENDESTALVMVVSIIASGPSSVVDISSICFDSPAVKLWQCILAMRLRDSSISEQLVTLACDPNQNWQLRRTAIFAAGRLPYEIALEKIVSSVLSERSPLDIDRNASLLCHSEIAWFLLNESQSMLIYFVQGKTQFISLFGDIFDAHWKECISSQDVPSGTDAASWLFDRLAHYGWPVNRQAPDLVINELHIPILHAAVLRSLRRCGRADLIEEQIEHSYHVWFTVKCIKERLMCGRPDDQIAIRLKSLVETSLWKDHWLPNRVIDECCGASYTNSTVASSVTAIPQAVESPVSCIQYIEVVRALTSIGSDYKIKPPFVFDSITAEQCEHLIRLLNPINDPQHGIERFVPSIRFVPSGHVVSQRQITSAGYTESINAKLRPALAAANKFGLDIPWHNERLTGILSKAYIQEFLHSLGLQNDSDRFYSELASNPDIFMHHICESTWNSPILKYVDTRIIPFLYRYVFSGTDEFFEGLCILALRVVSSEIDAVLSGLFYRWTQRFDIKSRVLQHHDNYHLWRGFDRLVEHPRFSQIDEWQSRLTAVLQAPIAWYQKQNIVRVLERDPRSYIQIEQMLFKCANFAHFRQEEIDRLDEAAERLFHELLED